MPEKKNNARKLLLPGIALLVIGCGLAGWHIQEYREESRLLRVEADAVPASLVPAAVSRGKHVYQSECAGCHGADAKGDRSRGMPDLTDRDWLFGNGLTSEIEKIVRYGIRAPDGRGQHMADMPAYVQAVPYAREPDMQPLSPGDVRDVVQYVLSKQGNSTDADAAKRGLDIFNGRGDCWDCHGDNARGDNASGSPNLTDNIWLYGDGSAAAITRSIEGGHQGVMPAFAGRLSDAAMLEVSLYVQSLSGKSAP